MKQDNSGIYERKSKKGLSLQIIIRYGETNNRKTFTRTIKVLDYPDKKSAYFAARMIRDQAKLDIANEKILENKCPTVDWFYKKHLDLAGISLKTKEHHNSVYNHSIIEFKDKPLDKVKTSDIQRELIKYAENHSQDQIKRVLYIWKAIYNTASMLEYPIADKTVSLKPIKSKKVIEKKNTATTIETFNLFCDELLKYNSTDGKPSKLSKDTWYMLQIMRWTGCRTAEALAINASDFDKDSHILHINKSIGSTGSKKRQVITTKTVSSVRDIPCTEELEDILNGLIEYSHTKPLLTAKDKKPYEIGIVSNHIRLVAKKTGINFNAYMLRHLFSTSLYNAGINPAVIRDLMGHTSSTMTLGYANTEEEERKKALESIAK